LEQQQEIDQARGSAAARGYGSRWRRLRQMQLAREPICQDPFGFHAADGRVVMAIEVDHIISKSKGGRDNLDNLQSLCKGCHSTKTAKMDGGFGRAMGQG
jgi:5-methylcytosine-specific restriction protein A